MRRVPLPVLVACDRVFALAPVLTWRLRYGIFLEVLRRDVEAPLGDLAQGVGI